MPDQKEYRNPPITNRQRPSSQSRQPVPPNVQQAPPPVPRPTPSTPPNTVTAAPPNPPPVINQPVPSTVTSPYYLAGYLQNFIGRFMRVEFLVGTSTMTDRTGYLMEVGASYIVLREFPGNDIMIGDLYSIKFVLVFEED